MRALFKKRYALKAQTAKNKARAAEAKAQVEAKRPKTAMEKIRQAVVDQDASLTEALSAEELERFGYRAPRGK
jgi:hypothetical protein